MTRKQAGKNWVEKNKVLILVASNIVFIGLLLWTYLGQSGCPLYQDCEKCEVCECLPCSAIDNTFRFGKDFKKEWGAHSYDCGECCQLYENPLRTDYIYAYGCDLSFKLTATPNVNNTLYIQGIHLNNQNKCRNNKVYVDGTYIGDMESCSKHDTTDCLEVEKNETHNYAFKVLPKKDVITVKISPSDTCYFGNDITQAWTET